MRLTSYYSAWEVRIVKNCDRGLENAAGSIFKSEITVFTIRTDPIFIISRQITSHLDANNGTFLLAISSPDYIYSIFRQITCLFFPVINWLSNGFVCLNWLPCRLQTIRKKSSQRMSNSDTRKIIKRCIN